MPQKERFCYKLDINNSVVLQNFLHLLQVLMGFSNLILTFVLNSFYYFSFLTSCEKKFIIKFDKLLIVCLFLFDKVFSFCEHFI